jgi:hypothetical protein
MRVNNALVVISVVIAFGLTTLTSAEARRCRRGAPPQWCGPQAVYHYMYYPRFRNVYYMAQFGPDPYPYPYVPRGYWPRYENPFWSYPGAYWYPNWAPNRPRYYAVPEPMPVPVEGCGYGCRRPYGYLK